MTINQLKINSTSRKHLALNSDSDPTDNYILAYISLRSNSLSMRTSLSACQNQEIWSPNSHKSCITFLTFFGSLEESCKRNILSMNCCLAKWSLSLQIAESRSFFFSEKNTWKQRSINYTQVVVNSVQTVVLIKIWTCKNFVPHSI